MSRDAYISIRRARTRVWGEPGAGAAVMVDLERSEDIAALRNVDQMVLRQRGTPMLIRTELEEDDRAEFIAEASRLFERWELRLDVSLLEQPIGEDPRLTRIHGDELAPADQDSLLQRARAAELRALLEWGKAIWTPLTYHYVLPSGEHSGQYIRLRDAIREPRDAVVLASWLHRHMKDRMGLLIDTGALNPIAFALMLAMERAGLTPNPVAVLDQYPRTAADVDAAIDLAADAGGNLLALLSITSSGTVLDRIYTALERKRATLNEVQLEVLIRRSPVQLPAGVEVWSPLPGEEPLLDPGANDATCELCRSPDRARICPISPRTLDEMLPAQLKQLMPSWRTALRNKRYWELADAGESVRVEAGSHPALVAYRSTENPMPIVVRLEEMLANPDFAKQCGERIAKLQAEEGLGRQPDLVLAPGHELGFAGYDGFWAGVRDVVAPGIENPVGYRVDDGDFSPELDARIREAEKILVFCLGSVTGISLQRGLIGVQSAKMNNSFDLEAVVLHARPATAREWEALTNAYGYVEATGARALHSAWNTLLPDRSPLREELSLLEELDAVDLPDEETRRFHGDRIKLCGGGSGVERPPLFWGSQSDDRLTPGSFFGEKLTARTAYAAVGAAMEDARAAKSENAAPEYRVFDLSAMLRSYYDPLLIASLFRWLRPHEAWWGWRDSDAETTVGHLLSRPPIAGRRILIPELLLAAAQGKVPTGAIPTLREFADKQLAVATGVEGPALKLGMHQLRVRRDL